MKSLNTTLVGLIAAWGMLASNVRAQIVVDWEQLKFSGRPAEIDNTKTGTFRVENLNAIAFSYHINLVPKETIPSVDSFFSLIGLASVTACEAKFNG
jgi:hypothetical protein